MNRHICTCSITKDNNKIKIKNNLKNNGSFARYKFVT